MLWYKLTQAKKKVGATVSQPKMKINCCVSTCKFANSVLLTNTFKKPS